ncbi:polyisoprenoid-binding protein [Novosphingobium endophyticum]|uniref:Polyisoprenoid-binding protein n=1 Tax=Novosphingobium endophyticum TaxID=1955250 RepID=A0A916X5F3_9SPHN|nr:YceI family protein [Novosphingobium endophyticum]GGC00003.1 polyisoprenoid-binding protein [Novosphingobium endophyticum]
MNRLLGTACVLPPALAFAAAFAMSTSLPAQDSETPRPKVAASPPGRPDSSLVSGGLYKADPDHTLVEWSVDHLGFSPYFGLFGDVTGTLHLEPQRPEQARVAVTIPVSSVTVVSPGLKQHLLKPPRTEGGKPDFFGPAPEDARFVSTMVRTTGEDQAEMTGNLTLNGITNPVTLDVRFHGAGTMPKAMGGGEVIGFEATGTFKRSDFGMDFSIPLVSDRVDLRIAAAFIKDTGDNPSGEN